MKVNIYCLGDEKYMGIEYSKTINFLKKEVESGKCIEVTAKKGNPPFYINSDFIFAFEEVVENEK